MSTGWDHEPGVAPKEILNAASMPPDISASRRAIVASFAMTVERYRKSRANSKGDGNPILFGSIEAASDEFRPSSDRLRPAAGALPGHGNI
jgi:hypothetical protein